MSSSQAGRILRRVTPPSRLNEDHHPESLWLWDPNDYDSPPALLWTDHMGEVVQSHETPMGACLLSPQNAVGWGLRRKVRYGETPTPSSDISSGEAPDQQIVIKPSPDKKMKKKKTEAKVDRWPVERYKAAEMKLVEVMHSLGAELRKPVPRPELRERVRKYIGDTGLLDHLLKHMAGKVVADGAERLRRQHNSEGAMEYWLEPVDLVEIRSKAGVTDPNWVPPQGWKLGDDTLLCPFGGTECQKEAAQLREEVASLKRDYQSLLKWKSKLEEELEEEEMVQGREMPLGGGFLPPLSAGLTGWGVRRKVKYTRRHREMPSLFGKKVEAAREQWIGKKRDREKAGYDDEEEEKRRGKEKDDRAGDFKVDRWSSARYKAAETKLVDIMHKMRAGLRSPTIRHALRVEMRKHIGDTGLLDHLLKHMVGKVVADGTERLQRRYTSEGTLEYWLEPADLAEIRQKAGVLDPCWVPPPGWKLGDTTSPCSCGSKCEKDMTLLREEVATLKRELELLNSLVQPEKQAKEALFKGGLAELAEMEGQGGRRYGWYVQLLTGTEGRDFVDER